MNRLNWAVFFGTMKTFGENVGGLFIVNETETETKRNVVGLTVFQTYAGLILTLGMIGAGTYGALDNFHRVTDADRQHAEILQKVHDGDLAVRVELKEVIHDQAEQLERYNDQFRNERIDRHLEKIREFEYRLRSPETDARDRVYYEQEITHSKEQIACIRRGEC